MLLLLRCWRPISGHVDAPVARENFDPSEAGSSETKKRDGALAVPPSPSGRFNFSRLRVAPVGSGLAGDKHLVVNAPLARAEAEKPDLVVEAFRDPVRDAKFGDRVRHASDRWTGLTQQLADIVDSRRAASCNGLAIFNPPLTTSVCARRRMDSKNRMAIGRFYKSVFAIQKPYV
jgi:hypothetical protein